MAVVPLVIERHVLVASILGLGPRHLARYLGAPVHDYQICQVLGHWTAEKYGQETANKAGGT